MAEIKRKKMLEKLENLKEIAAGPRLYLANYFYDLKNDIDKEIVPKLIDLQNGDPKRIELNEIWKEMITKITAFEDRSSHKRIDLSENVAKIISIETTLTQNDTKATANLDLIQEEIENEETSLMRNIFQNKSIFYFYVKNLAVKYKRQPIDGKLVILNNETIRQDVLKKR